MYHLVEIAQWVYLKVGPTAPVLFLLSIDIFALSADSVLARLRHQPIDDAQARAETLGRVGGIAQLTGLLGTVLGLAALFDHMMKPEMMLPSLSQAVISTVVGTLLSI